MELALAAWDRELVEASAFVLLGQGLGMAQGDFSVA
jgi:hypothetical protein